MSSLGEFHPEYRKGPTVSCPFCREEIDCTTEFQGREKKDGKLLECKCGNKFRIYKVVQS